MAFRFEAPSNRYATTIAELIGMAPRIQADAAMRIADARARAIEAKGAGRANLIGNLTTTFADLVQLPEKMKARRAAELAQRQAAELNALKLEGARGDLADAATAREQGKRAATDEALSDLGYQLFKFGHNPDAVRGIVGVGVKRGILSPEDGDRLSLLAVEQPDAIVSEGAKLLARSPKGKAMLEETVAYKPGDVVTNKLTGQVVHTVPNRPVAPTQASLALLAGQGDAAAKAALDALKADPNAAARIAETKRHNEAMEGIAKLNSGRQAAALAEQTRHNQAMERLGERRADMAGGFQWAQGADGAVSLMTPTEIRSGGATQPPTADMRNKEAGRGFVAKSIQAIEDLSKKIITRIGPAQRAAAIERGAEAIFGTDPDFRVYQDARMALAGNLAVAQQGSRPSDADIKSIWLPLVPDAYRDTAESANLKWGLIRTMSNAPAATSLSPNVTQFVEQNGVRYKVTTDQEGNVISSEVAP